MFQILQEARVKLLKARAHMRNAAAVHDDDEYESDNETKKRSNGEGDNGAKKKCRSA
jgi:hypothetical protein